MHTVGSAGLLTPNEAEATYIEDSYVVSPLQEGMLFHSLFAPTYPMYVRQIIVSLRETLNVPVLRQSWERVIKRHPILRSSLRWEGVSEPLQEVYSRIDLPFEQRDWCGLTVDEHLERLEDLLREERQRGFELSAVPLMRLKLIRLAESDFRMVWTFHHVLSDGHSDVLVIREVFSLYDSLSHGKNLELENAPSYREYCEWLQEQNGSRAEQYWRQRLRGFTEPSPLGMGLTLGVGREDSGAERKEQALKLSAQLTARLKSIAQTHGLTLSTMLHGTWALLLSGYSGKVDVVFGGVRGCRRSALGGKGSASIVGPFINTLPLRVSVQPDADLLTWLKSLRQQWIDLRDYEQTPLVKVLEWSELPRGTPLFESTVAYDKSQMNTVLHASGGPEWRNRELRTLQARSNYPLTLAAYGEDEFLITVRYDQDRFEDSSIELMLARLHSLFENIAENVNQKLSDLGLLTAGEERKLLYEWNTPSVESPTDRCVHELFEKQAALRPGETAVIAGSERLTYSELNMLANKVARYLRHLGVEPEQRVGICMERGPAMLVAILGVLKAGGAYVPLDLTYPVDRLCYVARDAGVRVLLSDSGFPDELAAACGCVVRLDGPDASTIERESGENPGYEIDPQAMAYVIHTSGSTGKPKGVVVSHRNIVRLFEATEPWFHFNERDVWSFFHSHAFDFSVWEIWGALLYGGRVVVVPFWVSRTPQAFYDLLVAENVTVLNQTPSAFRQLMGVEDTPGVSKPLSLRLVIFGGEALRLQSLRPWFKHHGDQHPRLVNMYGITETTVHVTYRPLSTDDTSGALGSMIGRRIPDLQIYLLDPLLRSVPVGVPGEIYVGGAGVARGYLGRPGLTAERFIPDPFGPRPGARLYKTGDVGRYLPNGDIQFLGRSDDQIKVRGFRIELGEIETVAVQHPGVQEAVVTVRADSHGQQRLTAYLVPDPRRAANVLRLLGFNAEGLHHDKALHEFPNGMAVFHLNTGETDFMYQEIFEERTYLQHGIALDDNACIFDVGANIGLFTLFAARASRDAVVYAFEPAPPVFDVLRANTELYGLNVKLFDCGLSESTTTKTFTYYPHISVVSGVYADDAEQRDVVKAFLLNREQAGNGEASLPGGKLLDELLDDRLTSERFSCAFNTLSNVIREHNVEQIDLLKIDVERSEWEVLAGIEDGDWGKIKQIVIEVHDVDGRLEEVMALLRKRGYKVAVQQDAILKNTGLYNVYAVLPTARSRAQSQAKDNSRGLANTWHSRSALVRDVREFLATQLPNYMLPADFVLLNTMPLTPNGKLDTRALPAPGVRAEEMDTDFVAPNSRIEKIIADIWADVLEVKRVGLRENFFALGGHSLLATQVISRLRESFGVDIPLRSIFDNPTVAGLAECITTQLPKSDAVDTAPMTSVSRERPLPLSFEQQRLWFLDQLMPGNPFYNVPVAYRITGRLNVEAIEHSINRIIERHEMLRTVFTVVEGMPAQHVQTPMAVRVQLVEAWEQVSSETELGYLIQKEGRRPFDLSRGPLLRAKLLRLTECDHVLVVTMHHIVADGLSMEVFATELTTLYEARCRGDEATLPALAVQYADYAVWQRRALEGAGMKRQLEYWKRQLAGTPLNLNLPTDYPRPSAFSFKGAFQPLEIDEQIFVSLEQLSRAEGATLFMTLLSAFAALLSRYSGQKDILIGAPIANRTRVELERLIGFFTNTLVLRIDVTGNPRFRELLHRVREVSLGAYAHPDVPFEKLVEELRPERDLSRNPLFQVAFSLQNRPAQALQLTDITIHPSNVDIETSKFDLCLYVHPSARSATGWLGYNRDLFKPETAVRMVRHLVRLLESIAARPDARLTELQMLLQDEQALLGRTSAIEDFEKSFSL